MRVAEVISPVNTETRRNLGVRPGDTVRVMLKIQEKGKTRLQAFEGAVLAVKHGGEAGATFTVRKVASGVGVEKTFPLHSPSIDSIEIIKRTKVRRSKLYYIREKAAKEIRRAMRNAFMMGDSTGSDIAEKEQEVADAEAKTVEEEAKKAKEAEEAKPEGKKEEIAIETEPPQEEKPAEEIPTEYKKD